MKITYSKNKKMILYVLYSILFTFLFLLYVNEKFSDNITSNFRLIFSHNEITKVMSGLETSHFQENITTPDDPGFLLLYALTSNMEGNSEVKVTSNPEDFPISFKLIYLFMHLGFIYLFVFTNSKVIRFPTKIIALAFLISPNLLSVFWGMDVYLFPIYTAIVSFYSIGELKKQNLSKFKMILCSGLSNVCEIFRKKSLLFLLPFLALLGLSKKLSLKSKFIYFVIFVVTSLSLNGLVGVVFKSHGHEVWHSLHAGLFEYGGCVGSRGESYPYFIFTKEELTDKSLVYCQDHWNDMIQYKVAAQKGVTTHFSKEYNDILKNQLSEILLKYPSKVLSLVVMRFFNALSFIPVKEYTSAGALIDFNMYHLFESLFFLSIFFFWLIKEKEIERKILFSSMLIVALPAPLLIHSSHIIYNAPLHFIQVVIVAEFFGMCFSNRNKKGEV